MDQIGGGVDRQVAGVVHGVNEVVRRPPVAVDHTHHVRIGMIAGNDGVRRHDHRRQRRARGRGGARRGEERAARIHRRRDLEIGRDRRIPGAETRRNRDEAEENAGDVDGVGGRLRRAGAVHVERAADRVDTSADRLVVRNRGVPCPEARRDGAETEQTAGDVGDVGRHVERTVLVDVEEALARARPGRGAREPRRRDERRAEASEHLLHAPRISITCSRVRSSASTSRACRRLRTR